MGIAVNTEGELAPSDSRVAVGMLFDSASRSYQKRCLVTQSV